MMLANSPTQAVLLSSETKAEIDGRRVLILMATYNGARYIEEQIRSIQAQSFSNWTLLIRDDGSRDDTRECIARLAQQDQRVQLVQDQAGNLGVIGNFSALMQRALEQNADAIFFADQDDHWHPDKLSIMLAGMQALERQYGADIPLLVHCDLAVVDADMQLIAPSFVEFMQLSPRSADLGLLLRQNQVTGCACLVNRAAVQLSFPIASDVLMHDWWLAQLCAATGKIGFVPQALVQYRQHGGNVVGAQSYYKRSIKLLLSWKRWKYYSSIVRRGIAQAGLLRERILTRGSKVDPVAMEQISTYSAILNLPSWKRISVLNQSGIRRRARGAELGFKLVLSLLQAREETRR